MIFLLSHRPYGLTWGFQSNIVFCIYLFSDTRTDGLSTPQPWVQENATIDDEGLSSIYWSMIFFPECWTSDMLVGLAWFAPRSPQEIEINDTNRDKQPCGDVPRGTNHPSWQFLLWDVYFRPLHRMVFFLVPAMWQSGGDFQWAHACPGWRLESEGYNTIFWTPAIIRLRSHQQDNKLSHDKVRYNGKTRLDFISSIGISRRPGGGSCWKQWISYRLRRLACT